jgi:hypothetical protein
MKDATNKAVPNGTDAVRAAPALDMDEEIRRAGGEWQEPVEFKGAVGRTMYDAPSSKDGTVTVLAAPENISQIPSQCLVRIKSRPKDSGGDNRHYLGAVTGGPFAEPDGLRADAPIIVTTTVQGAMFTPRYHGRVQVELLGEEIDGILTPPRFRPRPNSPVFVVGEDETSRIMGLGGDLKLGSAIGFQDLRVSAPSNKKSVLPRHLGVLGTTGGGKSTTVSGLVYQFQKAGIATVIIDTEGEYTDIGRPTEDKNMVKLLARQSRTPDGIANVNVHHLTGRSTTASQPTPILPFKVDFSSLSPFAVAELLDLTTAQLERFFKAFDVTKQVMREFEIFPKKVADEERMALELNEFDEGYPRMTLSLLLDVVSCFHSAVDGSEFQPYNDEFRPQDKMARIKSRAIPVKGDSAPSWRALIGKLARLRRANVFDQKNVKALSFSQLIRPSSVSIIDLSDTDSTLVNNLVIANILQGIQKAQDAAYEIAEKEGRSPTPVMVIIEEAHEFLSRDRIAKMENLFQQVARIARRGRKRWLGLVFVTQLPQHLPDEVLALINNFVLHKITDVNVISRLRHTIGGIDENLWSRLPSLAQGQAIVSLGNMTRPMLTAIDPTPCKLRMTE